MTDENQTLYLEKSSKAKGFVFHKYVELQTDEKLFLENYYGYCHLTSKDNNSHQSTIVTL